MIGHAEQQAMFDALLAAGARTYLAFGSAPINELVRVLAEHLEIRDRQVVHAAVMALVADGELNYSGSGLVSLPAGSDTRDTEEQA